MGPLGDEAGSRLPARGSLLEVGQVEELKAPVALDRAVDEDHVVDCGAGPVSAEGPPRAQPAPPPPRPGALSHLPEPTTGSPARRRWRWRHLQQEGSSQGWGHGAGLTGHCLGKCHCPR